MLHYNFRVIKRRWGVYKYIYPKIVLYVLIVLSLAGQAYANGGIKNPIKYESLGEAIGALVNAVITLSGIVAIGFLVYGGFLYITSGGDEQQIGKSKKAMGGGVIGLVLILLAYAIVRFILTGLGAS